MAEMVHIRSRNGLFRMPKWALLQTSLRDIIFRFCVNRWLISDYAKCSKLVYLRPDVLLSANIRFSWSWRCINIQRLKQFCIFMQDVKWCRRVVQKTGGMVWGRRCICGALLIIWPKYVFGSPTLSAQFSDCQSAILVEGLAWYVGITCGKRLRKGDRIRPVSRKL